MLSQLLSKKVTALFCEKIFLDVEWMLFRFIRNLGLLFYCMPFLKVCDQNENIKSIAKPLQEAFHSVS